MEEVSHCSLENLINSTNVTINQGENAVNMFFVSKAVDIPGSEVKLTGDGKQVQTVERKHVDEEEDDRNEKIAAMNEIADIQLHPTTSQLQTLLVILKNFVKLKCDDGFMNTLQKISRHVSIQPQISDVYYLAAEYMEKEKEFETVVVCKHLVSWFRDRATIDATLRLKRMVQENMSLARDAVKQMFEKKKPGKEIYHGYLEPMMYEMLTDVMDVPGVDPKTRTCMEALGSYFVACVLFFLKRWSEMYQVCHSAIMNMRRICGEEEARKNLAYGDVLLMAAVAKYSADEFIESEDLWEQTIQAFEAEGNTNGNSEMGMNISIAKQWLSIVRVRRQDSSTTLTKDSGIR